VVTVIILSVACKKNDSGADKLDMPISGKMTIESGDLRWKLNIRNNPSSTHFEITSEDGHQCVFDLYEGAAPSSGLSYRGGIDGQIIILDSKEGVVSSMRESHRSE